MEVYLKPQCISKKKYFCHQQQNCNKTKSLDGFLVILCFNIWCHIVLRVIIIALLLFNKVIRR